MIKRILALLLPCSTLFSGPVQPITDGRMDTNLNANNHSITSVNEISFISGDLTFGSDGGAYFIDPNGDATLHYLNATALTLEASAGTLKVGTSTLIGNSGSIYVINGIKDTAGDYMIYPSGTIVLLNSGSGLTNRDDVQVISPTGAANFPSIGGTTPGTGKFSSVQIGSDTLTDFTGSGLTVSGGALTLDRTGDWTGTLDGVDGSNYTRADLTYLGKTGNISSDSVTDTAAEWSALPVGYSRIFNASIGASGGLPSPSYYYITKIANRDSGGGWAGIGVALSSTGPGSLYVGQAYTSAALPTWAKIWSESNDGSGSGLDSDLLDGIDSTGFAKNGGNTNASALNIGTTDAYDLNFKTSGVTRVTVASGGSVGVNTANPSSSYSLDVTGATRITGRTYSTGTVQIGNANYVSGTPATYINFDKDSNGRSNFINMPGASSGGFTFEKYNGTSYTSLLTITGAGVSTFVAPVYANSFYATDEITAPGGTIDSLSTDALTAGAVLMQSGTQVYWNTDNSASSAIGSGDASGRPNKAYIGTGGISVAGSIYNPASTNVIFGDNLVIQSSDTNTIYFAGGPARIENEDGPAVSFGSNVVLESGKAFISPNLTAPTSTADSTGSTGEVRFDDNYLYRKTSSGWKRAALSTF